MAALGCLLCGGCGPAYMGPAGDTPQGRLEHARFLLENNRYYDASAELEAFISENPGTGLLDTALFYLGEAYLGREEYAMAAAEFERLLREFPGSGHAPAVRYKLGVAYYEQSLPAELDQTMTERGLEQFRLFMKLHPQSENVPDARVRVEELRGKLAKKRYLNGRLYVKLNQPEAARFYFGKLLESYPDTSWAPKAMLGMAQAYELEDNEAAAVEQYKSLLRSYPGTQEAARAEVKLVELGAGDVGGEAASSGERDGGSSNEEEP